MDSSTINNTKIHYFFAVIVLIFITYPVFFDIYRTSAFNTVPRDDYAPYLLTLIGENDQIPGAPFAYRVLSVAVAIPLYYFFPLYKFTNLENVNINYLKATQALSISSYLCLVLTIIVIYLIARKKYLASRESSMVVALLSILLSNFIARGGIDLFVVFIISLIFYYVDDRRYFIPLILVSVGINEKISIIFATIMMFRFLISYFKGSYFNFKLQFFFSVVAVFLYFIIVLFFKVPGNEDQLNPLLLAEHLHSSFIYIFTLKGLFLNLFPLLIVSFIAVISVKYNNKSSTSDISVLFVLFFLAMIADVVFNMGRIVMHSYPIYLPAVSIFIEKKLRNN